MRKWIALVLAALLCCCGMTALAEVGMANPWVETTADEVLETLGLELAVPEGATDVAWLMLEQEQLAELRFTWEGMEYVARVSPRDAFEDISGLYYEWLDEMEGLVGGRCPALTRRAVEDDTTVDVCLWYDEATGLMYSVCTSSQDDLDGFDIQAAAEQVYVPGQSE